jgi:hypothetical protein
MVMTATFPDVMVLDGGVGTELERRGYDVRGALWSAEALLGAPELVEAVHTAYLEAVSRRPLDWRLLRDDTRGHREASRQVTGGTGEPAVHGRSRDDANPLGGVDRVRPDEQLPRLPVNQPVGVCAAHALRAHDLPRVRGNLVEFVRDSRTRCGRR